VSGAVPFSAGDVARWAGGDLLRGDADARAIGASIDTRTLREGSFFFAIRGPNHDGHDHLAMAADAGARGLVVERGRGALVAADGPLAIVEVDDTTRALGAVAHGHRAGFRGPLIALTGSSGKTTTKEMCATVLSVQAPCLATRGNLNNEYGLPLTLLEREPKHELAVIELGMNHRGEIARLAAIAEPRIGLVTNIGTAHIEFLGSLQEIASEKGDLYAALPAGGVACANLDDPRVAEQARRAPCPALGYGRSAKAAIRAHSVHFEAGRFAFEIAAPEASCEVAVRGLSETTVINALAATAVGLAAGLSLGQVAQGLTSYQPIAGRMTPVVLGSGVTLIDDTYNANPDSMAQALESLRTLASGAHAIAVVGDMGELGDAADPAHRETGARAARLGIDALFALGERAPLVCQGAIEAGLSADAVATVTSHDDAAERVAALARPGDWVLIKGSRAMHMERVVAALEGSEAS
jgi:UDP-N-acetylmuramoyl-tripeptide--D-alanyl-D-alanine ligase